MTWEMDVRLFLYGLIPQLPCPEQNRVFDLGSGFLRDSGILPSSAPVLNLPENGDPDTVGPKRAAEDIDVELEAFARSLRRGVPIGDNHAAEGIRGIDRHERNGIQRRPPKETVDPQRPPGAFWFVVAEKIKPAFPQNGFSFGVIDILGPDLFVTGL